MLGLVRLLGIWCVGFSLCATSPRLWADAAVDTALKTIRSVEAKGAGNPAASEATRQLTAGSVENLLPILKAFDGANPLAMNWLRAAFESIAAKTLKAEQKLPNEEFEAFIQDRSNSPEARRLAYDWLVKVDPAVEGRLIPGMLDDPSPEFRREAVALKMAEAAELLKQDDKEAAKAAYQMALSGAVDDDQVKGIVKPLKELGTEVDLPKHFGFLQSWRLIGPFDNTEFKGFDTVYAPEKELDFSAKYEGKEGEVAWSEPKTTEDDYGVVDLAKVLAPHKGAVVYAATEFTSDRAQTVQFRLGTPNAWKIWVNGQLLFGRDEYHRGMQIDQYQVTTELKPGKNVVLLKVCQNEQKEDWAQRWQYQVRVCKPSGTAVLPSEGLETTSVR